jgi:hypothetical protein
VKRVVVALLGQVAWAPPGIPREEWRHALAEDVVDLLSMLAAADPAIAVDPVDAAVARAVAWPGMTIYEAATPRAVLEAAARDGYDQGAVVAADAPDVPGMILGKLLQPLETRQVAVAPAHDGGLLGVASRLPVPEWVPEIDFDGSPEPVRNAAPRRGLVAVTPGWHRLRGPADLARLDPALEGWDTTRALLSV